MIELKLQDWVGREKMAEDVLRVQPARFLQATLDRQPSLQDGDVLPPLWHWLYFLEAERAGGLGRDANPKQGDFLPPVKLPRRIWVGGRFTFDRPLILGRQAKKISRVLSVLEKSGRSGPHCFITIEHQIFQDGELAWTEEQDLVYREGTVSDTLEPPTEPARSDPEFSVQVTPTEVMLFRYSALTFNGHRIHYDIDYARDVEGYSGLVFHSPLLSILLTDLAVAQAGRAPRYFTFRSVAPISGLDPFDVIQGIQSGEGADLWVRRSDGALAMTARAEFA